MSERLHQLMQQIADEAARDAVLCLCTSGSLSPFRWVQPEAELTEYTAKILARALEYLSLRNLIEYDSTGRLVRFVEDGK